MGEQATNDQKMPWEVQLCQKEDVQVHHHISEHPRGKWGGRLAGYECCFGLHCQSADLCTATRLSDRPSSGAEWTKCPLLPFQPFQGAAIMNNTFCLGIFLGLVWLC